MEGERGMLAAAMSWPDLLGQLSGLAGEFVEQEADGSETHEGRVHGTAVTAGEVGGRVYLDDSSTRLSGCDDPDLIAELAVASGRLIVGCGADPAMGRYYLVAADRDGLLRCYHHCPGRMARPFEWGEPLLTEARFPLGGEPGGEGLRRALAYFGFDPEQWETAGHRRRMIFKPYSDPALAETAPGPLTRAMHAHYHWFQPHLDESGAVSAVEKRVVAVQAPRPLPRKLKYAVFPFRTRVRPEPGESSLRQGDGTSRPGPREDGGWARLQRRRAAEGA